MKTWMKVAAVASLPALYVISAAVPAFVSAHREWGINRWNRSWAAEAEQDARELRAATPRGFSCQQLTVSQNGGKRFFHALEAVGLLRGAEEGGAGPLPAYGAQMQLSSIGCVEPLEYVLAEKGLAQRFVENARSNLGRSPREWSFGPRGIFCAVPEETDVSVVVVVQRQERPDPGTEVWHASVRVRDLAERRVACEGAVTFQLSDLPVDAGLRDWAVRERFGERFSEFVKLTGELNTN